MLPVKYQSFRTNDEDRQVLPLTKNTVALIEENLELSVTEKINLLALLSGHKYVTDLAINGDKESVRQFLARLELPFADNYYVNVDGARHEWLQVAVSRATLSYVLEHRDTLTVLEAGVLYGYPASATLAYIGVLEKVSFEKNTAEHFLSGVFSRPFAEREREHFRRMWDDIAQLSPKIVTLATAEYKKNRKLRDRD